MKKKYYSKEQLIEYEMSAAMASSILKKEKDKKKDKQVVLCDYVNSNLGLKGTCIKVYTY